MSHWKPLVQLAAVPAILAASTPLSPAQTKPPLAPPPTEAASANTAAAGSLLSKPSPIRVPADYVTIQAALDAAKDGDEIVVAPGQYFETLEFPPKAVWLHSSEGPESTIIDSLGAGGSVILFLAGTTHDSIVQGFTLTGGLKPFGGGIACAPGAEPSILDNWIIGNTATFDGGGIFPRPENTVVIVGNVIAWNTANGQAGGLQAPSGASTVKNNLFIGNQANYGGAYFSRLESSVTLENNTFVGNMAPNGSAFAGDGGLTLLNCIVWNHATPAVNIFGNGTLQARYTLFEGASSAPWFGTGCIDAYPRFVSPSTEDFRLRRNSPCVDAGDPSSPLDADGTRADMGALPYQHRRQLPRTMPVRHP